MWASMPARQRDGARNHFSPSRLPVTSTIERVLLARIQQSTGGKAAPQALDGVSTEKTRGGGGDSLLTRGCGNPSPGSW